MTFERKMVGESKSRRRVVGTGDFYVDLESPPHTGYIHLQAGTVHREEGAFDKDRYQRYYSEVPDEDRSQKEYWCVYSVELN